MSSPPVSNRTYNNRVACFLKSIGLKNILSFKDAELPLGSLNVLIGPNGAGKSNLIDVIGLLQAAPGDLNGAILRGGGAPAWVRKGEKGAPGVAAIECEFVLGADQLAYSLEFSAVERGLVIEHERLKRTPKRSRDHRNAAPGVYFERSVANMQFWDPDTGGMASRKGGVSASGSLFSMLRSPIDKTPITPLGMELERIRVYRSFNTGMDARARNGTGANVPKEFLDDGGDNLAAVLHEMRFDGSIERVNQYVRRLADQFEDVRVRLDAGSAQTYLKEKGIEQPISAVRLSDGTLKFLCLMAVLLHANPPPLICMEEPELGLHPDALQLVAEVLRDAADRSQLIVTTHSEALIDALSGRPDAVVVCERDFDNATSFQRLSREGLGLWLERYRLGELWRKGQIGGNRW